MWTMVAPLLADDFSRQAAFSTGGSRCVAVIAASFQNKSMTSEFQKLFGPASPLADRRKAQAMNPRVDLKYFSAESLRKAGELEKAVSQAL